MAYINQTEINNFINKAQQKIAFLGSDIATATENDLNYDDELALSDELSSLINSIIDPWLDWDEKDIIRYIHFYNNKAKITDIPYSAIPKLRMKVVWPEQLVTGGDVTQAELDAEIAARIAADIALQVNIDIEKLRIDNLDFSGDLAAALSEYTKTVNLFLPTGDNKTALEALTTALVAEISANTTHAGNGAVHVLAGEKAYWNAKVQNDDVRLSDARTPLAHQHPVSDVTGLVTEVQTQVDAYVTALNLQDGVTPAFVAANVIEGSPLAVSIDDSGGAENLVLNMTVPPPEKGDQGDPFTIGAQGLASDRFDSIYNGEDANFAYLGTDDGNLYFRTPLGGSATSTGGWSAGTPFTGENGWSPVLATQTVSPEKEVHVLLDWIGGTGSKPVLTPPSNPPNPLIWYVSPGGYTVFVNDATNIKGGIGATGADGEKFIINDSDVIANLSNYDSELRGFTLLITDISPNVIYQKLSDTSGDWGGAYEWQGPVGSGGGGSNFDGNRVIKSHPDVGQNFGTNNVNDFLEAAFFQDLIALITQGGLPLQEVGVSYAPTITGTITPRDSIINTRRVREIIGNTVEATPAGNAVSEPLSAIIMVNGTNRTYRIEADVTTSGNNTQVVSPNRNLSAIFPYFTGFGAAGLTGNPFYTSLNKSIQNQGNYAFLLSGVNNRMYIAFPDDYPDLTSILDPNGFQILGSVFPSSPSIRPITASGLANNWTKNYKVYESSVTTANGLHTITH